MIPDPTRRLAVVLLLLAPAIAMAMPAPYTARYEVRRNGERLGEATVALKPIGGGRAEFSSSIVGSEGMAALTSATIDERSVMRWSNGAPETVSWDFRQKVAWKTREKSLAVDAQGGRIDSRDKDKRFSPPYKSGVLDRNAVTVALMQDLAAGRNGELRYLVPDRNQLQPWLFRVGASERMSTPLGTQRVLKVQRIRESGDGRMTTLWLGQDRGFVPLRILQQEPDGESIEMRILSLR